MAMQPLQMTYSACSWYIMYTTHVTYHFRIFWLCVSFASSKLLLMLCLFYHHHIVFRITKVKLSMPIILVMQRSVKFRDVSVLDFATENT